MDSQQPHQMPRFPRLVAGSSHWCLPLADHVACELARQQMQRPEERAASIAELMALDPALTLWTACAAGRRQVSAPTCVAQLAQWFALHGAIALKWSAEELAEAAHSSAPLPRWRKLSIDSVAVANIAGSQPEDDAVASQAFLLGILHNALDWLRSCGPRVLISKAQESCLPPWLVSQLHQRAKSSRPEAVQAVMDAASTWRETGKQKGHVAGIDLSDLRKVRRWWQPSAAAYVRPVGEILPALVKNLNRLQQLERHFQQTLEHEKLDALGELAYGASHEINNPLLNISSRAEALLRDETDPERRRMLAVIDTQAFRANEMISDMMLFARPPQIARRQVDLVNLIDTVITELADETDQQGSRMVRAETPQQFLVQVDPTHIAVAIRALCINALEALGSGGTITLSISHLSEMAHRPGRGIRIIVADTGPGVTPETRRHMFDPFYSGREAGRGLGLGLAKCWRVVTIHGGQIHVESEPGHGTRMIIDLPVHTDGEKTIQESTDDRPQE